MKKIILTGMAGALVLGGFLAVNGCGESDAKNNGPIPDVDHVAPVNDKPVDAKSKEIEKLTGNHTRIVWAQQQNPQKTDAHGNGTQFKLLGFDTRDGKGERIILDKVTNYARPLLTPDGKRIVFNDKGTKKDKKGAKSYHPRCFVVNWDGRGLKELGEGYADEIWADPATGKFWVYVVSKFKMKNQSATEGSKLDRFLLDDPSKRETVYGNATSPNNIMISRDGSMIGGLFPWSHGGRLDVKKQDWEKTVRGCWTAISPDNSYVTWTFDGKHQNVWMHTPDEEKWEVPINTLSELRGREVYHPRWTNHPQFFAISGPYPNGTRNVEGKKVQIYIGKFSTNLAKVADWVKVTENKLADIFPDVWISGGEQFSLPAKLGPKAKEAPLIAGESKTPSTPKAEAVAAPNRETPVAGAPGEGLVFLWRNNDERNKLGSAGDTVDCKLTISGRARFDRLNHLLTGGGMAVVDQPTAAYADRFLGKSPVTLSLVARPADAPQKGTLLEFAGVRVGQDGGNWTLALDGKSKSLPGVSAGQPAALVLSIDPSSATLEAGGKSVVLKKSNLHESARASQLRIGDGSWDGAVGQVHLYSRLLGDAEKIALTLQSIAESTDKNPPARLTFKGKLLTAASARKVEDMGAYKRLLVPCVYEVEEVTSGAYDKKRIVVFHWAMLDLNPLSSFPPPRGESLDVTVEPFADHPELQPEQQEALQHSPELEKSTGLDELSFITLPQYFDISTPKP